MNKKERKVKVDLNTRIGKYFVAKKEGMNKTEASIVAGYPSPTHSTRIEQSQAYQAIEAHYKDELLKHISLQEIAEINARNIRQERDVGGSNTALKLALEKIEPEAIQSDENDRVIVVLR